MKSRYVVKVERIDALRDADIPLPSRETPLAAGFDLRAALPLEAPLTLMPMQRALVPTGLKLQLPEGTEGQVRPRSGLAFKHGLTLLNSPGTIDADYRGEVKVLMINLGQEAVTLHRGERIAQLVVAPVLAVVFEEGPLDETLRGQGGFGSTGR